MRTYTCCCGYTTAVIDEAHQHGRENPAHLMAPTNEVSPAVHKDGREVRAVKLE